MLYIMSFLPPSGIPSFNIVCKQGGAPFNKSSVLSVSEIFKLNNSFSVKAYLSYSLKKSSIFKASPLSSNANLTDLLFP